MLLPSVAELKSAGRAPRALRQPVRRLGSLVAPSRELDVLERQWLLTQDGRSVAASILPTGDVREVLVVPQRLAIFGLALDSEVPAGRLRPVPGIQAQQLRQLQEVGDPPGPL